MWSPSLEGSMQQGVQRDWVSLHIFFSMLAVFLAIFLAEYDIHKILYIRNFSKVQ